MIDIHDNGEKLVDIKKVCPKLIIDMRGNNNAYLRETVAGMLKKAVDFLPDDYTFMVRDAWRPVKRQKMLNQMFYRRFKGQHPEWSEERIKKEMDVFVAPYEGKDVSGHMAGGAVDLRLAKNGRRLPMKSKKLTYQENALSHQPKLPKYMKRYRKIMFDALEKSGLSNYPKEFWHWSYGDTMWAEREKKNIAIYGKVDR